MKIIRFDEKTGRFFFRFDPNEQMVFRQLLADYPVQNGANNRISARDEDEEIANEQELLEDCLDEHRAAVRAQLDEFLNDGDRLAMDALGGKLTLDAAGIDWLLQILNDIRIGNWRQLGKPDPEAGLQLDSLAKMRNASSMQVCGYWQSMLLRALNAPVPKLKPKPKRKRAVKEKMPAKAKVSIKPTAAGKKGAVKKKTGPKAKAPAKPKGAAKTPKAKRKQA